jgi:predicted hydrocarbon binding protein
MENSILGQLVFEPGRLTFKDVPYILIRPEVIAALHKGIAAEVGPEKCAEIMQAAGSVGGAKSSQRFKELFGYNEQQIVEFMCQMGGEIGWGVFRLAQLDLEKGQLVVEITESPFAAAYGPAESSVCHLIRGVLTGLGGSIFGGPVSAIETACAAKGDLCCRFEVGKQ